MIPKQTLSCGCVPGFFLCADAEKLWRAYRSCSYEQEQEARKAYDEYDKHVSEVKI